MPLEIRRANNDDMSWVNSRYAEVEFVPSNLKRETIALSLVDGEKAGLGRLVRIDEGNLELGGMLVLEPYRGQGLARELVKFLLTHVHPYQSVYCIPFQTLIPFYQSCGFESCTNESRVPEVILDKLRWCGNTYSEPTSLLVLKSAARLRIPDRKPS